MLGLRGVLSCVACGWLVPDSMCVCMVHCTRGADWQVPVRAGVLWGLRYACSDPSRGGCSPDMCHVGVRYDCNVGLVPTYEVYVGLGVRFACVRPVCGRGAPLIHDSVGGAVVLVVKPRHRQGWSLEGLMRT